MNGPLNGEFSIVLHEAFAMKGDVIVGGVLNLFQFSGRWKLDPNIVELV